MRMKYLKQLVSDVYLSRTFPLETRFSVACFRPTIALKSLYQERFKFEGAFGVTDWYRDESNYLVFVFSADISGLLNEGKWDDFFERLKQDALRAELAVSFDYCKEFIKDAVNDFGLDFCFELQIYYSVRQYSRVK